MLTYSPIPLTLRGQVAQIIDEVFGLTFPQTARNPWERIHEIISREVGRHYLSKPPGFDSPVIDWRDDLRDYLLHCNTDEFLDAVETAFKYADGAIRNKYEGGKAPTNGRKLSPDEAIEELNYRFLQYNLGYQFGGGQLIKASSTYIHDAVTLPALNLLHAGGFSGAEDEFRKAQLQFRAGDHKGAVVSSGNAVESTMKHICHIRGLVPQPPGTAAHLMSAIWGAGLVPTHLDEGNTGLRSTFNGFFALRNKSYSAHGQGITPVDLPEHIAAYALHLAASCIVFLVKQNAFIPVDGGS